MISKLKVDIHFEQMGSVKFYSLFLCLIDQIVLLPVILKNKNQVLLQGK